MCAPASALRSRFGSSPLLSRRTLEPVKAWATGRCRGPCPYIVHIAHMPPTGVGRELLVGIEEIGGAATPYIMDDAGRKSRHARAPPAAGPLEGDAIASSCIRVPPQKTSRPFTAGRQDRRHAPAHAVRWAPRPSPHARGVDTRPSSGSRSHPQAPVVPLSTGRGCMTVAPAALLNSAPPVVEGWAIGACPGLRSSGRGEAASR